MLVGILAVLAGIALVIGLWLGITAIMAAVLSWAWNLVIPTTFGGPVLDFGAAFALIVVLRILFGFLRGGSNVSVKS